MAADGLPKVLAKILNADNGIRIGCQAGFIAVESPRLLGRRCGDLYASGQVASTTGFGIVDQAGLLRAGSMTFSDLAVRPMVKAG